MGEIKRSCAICQSTEEELRPYGKNGTDICFDCMIATPEREAEAKKNFAALLNANDVLGNGVTIIGGEDGPIPFIAQEVQP